MKKQILFMLGACLALASCSKQEKVRMFDDERSEQCDMTLSVKMPQTGKAVNAFSDVQPYESRVNDVQILIFDSVTGKIDKYVDAQTNVSGINVTTSTGAKTVWAVVNGEDCSGIATISELESKSCSLDINGIDGESGFLMTGSTAATLIGGVNQVAVSVSRIAGRIALLSIKNNLPAAHGDILVNSVWLANGVGNQTYSGSAELSGWFNRQSRADEEPQVEGHIIDGDSYKATFESLSFKDSGDTISLHNTFSPTVPYLFYTYANDNTSAPSGFDASFKGSRSVLVIKTTISGQVYYYPVSLNTDIERNTTYTVALTISSLGIDEPNKTVDKGTAEVTLSVDPWLSGAVFEPEI